jgi:hypothetical protein
MSESATEDYRKTLRDEYGEFVALQQIYFDGALAYNVGDPVPKSNVEAHGYLDDGLVARTTTKAAAKAKGDANS